MNRKKTLSPASLFRVLFMISSRRCEDQTGTSLLAADACLAGGGALVLSLSSSPSSSPVAPALPSGSVSPSPAAGAQPPRGLWPRPPPSGKEDQRVTIGQLANHSWPHEEKPHERHTEKKTSHAYTRSLDELCCTIRQGCYEMLTV